MISCITLFLISSFKVEGDYQIYWNSKTKLKWEDFKGRPEKNIDPSFDAITASSIKYVFSKSNDTINIAVYSIFYKIESWQRIASWDHISVGWTSPDSLDWIVKQTIPFTRSLGCWLNREAWICAISAVWVALDSSTTSWNTINQREEKLKTYLYRNVQFD